MRETPEALVSVELSGPVTKWPARGASLKSGLSYKVILTKDGKKSTSTGTIRIDHSDKPLSSQRFLLMDFGNPVLK